MPKQSLHVLRWSATDQIYQLFANGQLKQSFGADDAAWPSWLAAHSSFAFDGQHGRLSVIKEARARGAGYWYAYRATGRRTSKRYLGTTSHVTIARLEEIASLLAHQQAAQPAAKSTATHTAPHSSASLLLPKLLIPRLATGLVTRPRLLRQLDAGLHGKLIVITAPAGFGKTTIVRQWVDSRRGSDPALSVAWVSLDDGDNDPVRFWQYVITAFQSSQAAVGQAALQLLAGTRQVPLVAPPLETAITLLLNDLMQQRCDGVLVLDDVHVIRDAQIYNTFRFFIEHLPTTLQVILITRSEPGLPLLRWRASGQLVELHATNLRFSLEETAAFLSQMLATPIEETALKQIDLALEGWPAGLRLLTLKLQAQTSPDAIQHMLSSLNDRTVRAASHQPIMEYFVTEILQAQLEPLQDFLLQTSMLSRLTASLCDAVTGRQDSAVILEHIARAGLFLDSLDGARTWYRYHALFAEALHSEAQRRLDQSALQRFCALASQWYEDHRLPAEAIETALLAQTHERAAQLIEQADRDGHFWESQTLQRWLAQLPETVLHAHPLICLMSAITLRFAQGGVASAALPDVIQSRIAQLLQQAEQAWRRQGKPAWIGAIHAFHAMSALTEGPATEAAAHAQAALDLLPDSDPDPRIFVWRSICLGIVGGAKLYEGHFAEARQIIREAHANSLTVGIPHFTREMRLSLGLSSFALGELHEAHEHYRLGLAAAREQQDPEHIANALLGLARIAYEWNNLHTAEAQVNEALAVARNIQHDLAEIATIQLVEVLYTRGAQDTAQQQMAALLARLPSVSPPYAVIVVPIALTLHGRILLELGEVAAAQQTWEPLLHPHPDLPVTSHALAAILHARLLLAQDQIDAAQLKLEQLLAAAQARSDRYSLLEVYVLLAQVHAAGQRDQSAQQWLICALTEAYPEKFLRFFVNEGAPLARVLRSLIPIIEDAALRAYAQTILRAFTQPHAAAAPVPDHAQPHLLSAQEQRVLRLLAAGHTNAEIARDLIISVNTVKDHVKHVYRKLNVNTRIQASEKARRLNLV